MLPENGDEPTPPPLDARLIQWLALQMVHDARARLVEGGAGADAAIELATVFVDLAVTVRGECDRHGVEDDWVIQRVCAERATTEEDGSLPQSPELDTALQGGRGDRWLLVGGPGSGKSTATTMIAQLLRRPWVEQQQEALPESLKARVESIAAGLDALAEWLGVQPRRGVLPLRVNLPGLAQWMVSQNSDDPGAVLWRYLATRMTEDAAAQGQTIEVTESDAETMIGAVAHVLWIFDGLDEVPRTAGRDNVVAVVRSALASQPQRVPGLLVTTRPQGYEGELDDLATMVLEPMAVDQARDYGERLLQAWIGEGPELTARRETLHTELDRPEIQALVQTPLHTTMAALLVAMEGSLPRSRWLLFDHYFTTIFKRELSKPGSDGIRAEDQRNIRDLHARVGLVLHVRAQDQAGARPTLSRRELREELAAIFRERGHAEEDVSENRERMMRFATERLVLLLHARSGEYSFGVRSLQEFFAADALLRGERTQVRKRLEVIALNPHWSNVLALVTSKCALADGGQSQSDLLDYTAGLCRALNDGTLGGEAAKHCLAGSRLALAMLRETERYGEPWLHNPLWETALEAATSPVQRQVSAQSVAAARESSDDGSSPALWNDHVEVHARLGLVAAGWDSVGNKIRRRAILHAAKGLLSGTREQRLAGWFLLYGLLLVNEPEAIKLSDQIAPEDRDEARSVLRALLEECGDEGVPSWTVQFIRTHPEWFTPAWMPWGLLHHDPAVLEVSSFAVAHLLDFGRGAIIPFVIFRGHYRIHVASIDSLASRWRDLSQRLPSQGAGWEVWRHLALFHTNPSNTALANLLEAAAESVAFNELKRGSGSSAWPVVACVEFIDEPGELRALAQRVRDGDLGTIEDWRAAEARWRVAPDVTPEELHEWLSPGPLPWNRMIAERGVVLAGTPGFGGGIDVTTTKYTQLRDNLLYHITVAPRKSARAAALWEWLIRLSRFSRVSCPPEALPLDVARSVEDLEPCGRVRILFCVDQILPDLTGSEADGWFKLLDERGRQGRNQSGSSSGGAVYRRRCLELAAALVQRLRERPEQWGIASALLVMLRVVPGTNLTLLPPLQAPADAPADIHATTAFLRLLSSKHDAAEFTTLIQQLVTPLPESRREVHELMTDILTQRTRDPDYIVKIIVAALEAGPSDELFRDALLGALFARLRRSPQPSFATEEAWREHGLPKPFLPGQEPERAPPRLVRLVELTNLRLFKETPSVDVPFPVPSASKGQWLILTGENGIGKTTLLRALALVLASPAVASKLLDERLPMVRNGGEGHVTTELDTGVLDAVVRIAERTETVERGPLEADSARRPWVVGYGVRRGNARGETDREPEWGAIGELHTLFDRPASLVNASDWLIKLDRQVLREERQQPNEASSGVLGSRAAIWQSVVEMLKTLLGVTAVEPADEHVFVQHPQFGRVRLDALSDGYLTTTGWVIDLVARWIDRQRVLDEPVGPNVLWQMTGFVLVDEIDLHLHPIWQMKVIDDVRKLFPRLSFVVTTHNPLTLQGSRRGEVYVMRRDGARIELVQRDIRPGHDVDRVLFEQFGIEHTFDKETRELLRKHRELLAGGALPSDPARIEVESRLAERLGGVGEIVGAERRGALDPLPRLAPHQKDFFTQFLKTKPS